MIGTALSVYRMLLILRFRFYALLDYILIVIRIGYQKDIKSMASTIIQGSFEKKIKTKMKGFKIMIFFNED
jgi:hypothetical protein